VLERPAFFRQLVLDAHRRLRDDEAADDPLSLELSQALRQHPIADVRDGHAELGEPHPSVEKQLDHRARPPAAD
jgi:hypothetical protein